MRGIGKSIYYWLYNMEKTFGAMFLVVAAVITFQVLMGGADMEFGTSQMYVPMMGSIMLIAMLMNNATHFIPQSLSYGGTRKEVLVGMEIVIHLMMMQMMLVIMIGRNVLPKLFPNTKEFLNQCFLIYLICGGLGNFLCACSLKYGAKIGMILYMILVIGASISIGLMFAFSLNSILKFASGHVGYGVIFLAAVLLDGVMIAFCYLAIRKYEVRS